MKNIWTNEEKKKLTKIYKIINNNLKPIEGKKILILCSANGDLALTLTKNNKNLHIVGLELDDTLLKESIAQKNT